MTQTVEPLFCRETVKCFVQVILLLRLNKNRTNFKYNNTIFIKSFTVKLYYVISGIDLSTLMEMGQAAGMEGDVARKAKVYYPIIRKFQNNHMALEKV